MHAQVQRRDSTNRFGHDSIQRIPEVVSLFQEVRKTLLSQSGVATAGGGGGAGGGGRAPGGLGAGAADRAGLMEEMAGKSKYLTAIREDTERYREEIESLSAMVQAFRAGDMEGVCTFVEQMDAALSILSDENAVLKGFEWPEARVDALRESSALYRENRAALARIEGYAPGKDSWSVECTRMSKCFEDTERLIQLRSRSAAADAKRFESHEIPWSGEADMAALTAATLTIAKCYMLTTAAEGGRMIQLSEEQQGNEAGFLKQAFAVLTNAIRFAFRVHQLTHGFDRDCQEAFADIQRLHRLCTHRIDGA